MLCWAYHSSCLVWISFLPIFWQLLLDQWVWIHHWFPPKWWLLSWPHPRVIPAKTAKVWFARNPVRPGHVMWMTKKRRGLCLKKYKNIESITVKEALSRVLSILIILNKMCEIIIPQLFSLSSPLLFTWGGLKYQGSWEIWFWRYFWMQSTQWWSLGREPTTSSKSLILMKLPEIGMR